MKILFVEPVGSGLPPMGLLYLIPPLKKAGFKDIEFISIKPEDTPYERSLKKLDDILKKKPGLVCITATNPVVMDAAAVAKKAKSAGAYTILGGPGPTNSGQLIMDRFPYVDMVYKGEAENTIVSLAKKVEKGDFDFSDIKGAMFRKGGKIIEQGTNPLIMNLDGLDFPDRSLLPFATMHGVFSIVTSRGCPFNCAFCFKPIHGRTFRARTPENVIAEIKEFVKQYPKEFEAEGRQVVLADDIFNFNMDRAKKIFDEIINSKLDITVIAVNGFHANRVDEELLRKYKQANGKVLWFGADAGSEKVLGSLGKYVTLAEIRKAIVLAKKVGIETVGVHFIIGLEGETPETAQEMLDFAASLPVDDIGFNHANVLPGTRLWDFAAKHGKLLFKTDGLDFTEFKQLLPTPKFETPEFTKEQRIEAFEKSIVLMDSIRRRNTLKPHKIINFLKGLNSIDDVFWAFERAKIFFFGKNLRLIQKREKPSILKLKTTTRTWPGKKKIPDDPSERVED